MAYTSHHHGSAHGRPSATSSLIGLATALLDWPARVIEHRRLMSQMAGMSDHELRDIGLMRQDVNDATAVGYDRDPSKLLAGRADARRRWSHH